MTRKIRQYLLALAALAAAGMFATPSMAQYYGDAPWCAVQSIGTGEVVWYCYYHTVEECVPNVIAGNRGFCNVNPYAPPGSHVAPAPHKHHKRKSQS
jgi:hypothetical protein